jgi:biotin carboxyl carrier protein
MKKKYKVTVSGKVFEVEVELIDGSPTVVQAVNIPQAPLATPSPAMGLPPSIKDVVSPIPGKIQKIQVAVGDMVAPGRVLLVIEAMKMDNEIMADVNAEVAQILVKEGDQIQIGQTLIRYS